MKSNVGPGGPFLGVMVQQVFLSRQSPDSPRIPPRLMEGGGRVKRVLQSNKTITVKPGSSTMLVLQLQVMRMVFIDSVTCLKQWVPEANILSWTSWDPDILFLFSSPSFPPIAPGTFHAVWTRAWNLYCFSILTSAREGFKNCFVEGRLVMSGKHSEASKWHLPLHQNFHQKISKF